MSLPNENSLALPQVKNSFSFQDFFYRTIKVLKKALPSNECAQRLESISLSSRISLRQTMLGKRKFAENKISSLATTLDMSGQEESSLLNLSKGNSQKKNALVDYRWGSDHILSHLINTIILNLCALPKKPNSQTLGETLSSFFSKDVVAASIENLIKQKAIIVDEDGCLKRIDYSPLSLPQGIKFDCAKAYLTHSLDLVMKGYDLDLADREYTSFTVMEVALSKRK